MKSYSVAYANEISAPCRSLRAEFISAHEHSYSSDYISSITIEAPQIDGTPIEVHFRPAFTRSPLRFRRMDRWFKNHADECMQNNFP